MLRMVYFLVYVEKNLEKFVLSRRKKEWIFQGSREDVKRQLSEFQINNPNLSLGKISQESLGNGKLKVVLSVYYTKSKEVRKKLEVWLEKIKSGHGNEEPLRWAVSRYNDFITIHPFANGNRKIGLLIFNTLLEKVDLHPSLPPNALRFHVATTLDARVKETRLGLKNFQNMISDTLSEDLRR